MSDRHSSRPSSSREHRDHHRRRSPSPRRHRDRDRQDRDRGGRDVREREKRSDDVLPDQFSRDHEEKREDNRNVLERMEKAYSAGPLSLLTHCRNDRTRVKVWTRNFKEVRGICTGFVTFFDKHWNLVMEDVDEICLKAKKGKTPYLRNLDFDFESIPEAQPKVPREKGKPKKETTEEEEVKETVEKKTKKKKSRKKSKLDKRFVPHLFIRGDNVVMIAVVQAPPPAEETMEDEEEEGEEKAAE